MLSWFRRKTPTQPGQTAAGQTATGQTATGQTAGGQSAAGQTATSQIGGLFDRQQRPGASGDLARGVVDPETIPLDLETLPFPENEPEGALAESARVLAAPAPTPAPADPGPSHAAQPPALAFYAGEPDSPASPTADEHAAQPAEPDLVATAVARAGLPGDVRAETLTVWAAVLERHGGAGGEEAWRGVLLELRRRRLRAPALAVAEALAAAHPDALWPLAELARLQAAGTDHAAKLELGRRLCARWPDASEGPPLVVQGLLGLDRRDEAERFFDGLPDSFADQDWYLTTGMRFARAHDDVPRVLALAARLRAVTPDRPLAYAMPAVMLRQAGRHTEAEAVVADGVAACPGSAEIWREAALTAQALGDTPLAFQRWEGLRAHAPNALAGYVGAVQLAERLRQPETLAGLLDDGLLAYPDDRDLLMAKARASAEAGDWDDATDRWTALIARTPNDPATRVAAATALMGPAEGRAARLPQIQALLEETVALFPDHVPAGIAHMRLLREAGELAQARDVGAAWGARFPDNQALATARSRIAALDRQPDQALAILQATRAVSPRSGLLEAAYARALSVAGRVEEADEVCAQALANLPGDAGLLAEHTRIAMRREDWKQALGRAEQAVQARPEDPTLQAMLARAKAQGALVDHE